MFDGLEFIDSKDIDAQELLALFRRERWNDFMSLDDTEFYLSVALQILTAWKDDELIGFARLSGDGRIDVEISDVLVRSDFQGQGIGTELVRRQVQRIRELDPYYIQVCPIGDREVHLYGKFGFTIIPDYLRMELITPRLERNP